MSKEISIKIMKDEKYQVVFTLKTNIKEDGKEIQISTDNKFSFEKEVLNAVHLGWKECIEELREEYKKKGIILRS